MADTRLAYYSKIPNDLYFKTRMAFLGDRNLGEISGSKKSREDIGAKPSDVPPEAALGRWRGHWRTLEERLLAAYFRKF